MIDASDTLLREEAAALWRAQGQPTGRDLDIWLEAEARLLPTLPPAPIVWSRWSADRRQLLARHGRRELRVWEVSAAKPVPVARFRVDGWSSAAAGPDGIVTAGFECWPHRLVVCDPRGGRVVAAADLAPAEGYRLDVHHVGLSDDGRRAAVSTRQVWTDAYDPAWSDSVTTLDVRTREISALRDSMGPILDVARMAIAADGSALALLTSTWAPGSRGVSLFDAASGEPRWRTWFDVGGGDSPRHLLLSEDGGTLGVIMGPYLHIWDARTGTPRETHTLEGSLDVATLSAGGRVLAAGGAGTIRAWRLGRDTPVVVSETSGTPLAIAVEADGSALLVADHGRDATVPRMRRLPLDAEGRQPA
jgi:hypothetical protein